MNTLLKLLISLIFLSRIIVNGDDKMSSQIKAVLEHYKSADPVGIPGNHIPDPMPIPSIKRSFSLTTLNMFNLTIHGLSQFRIDNVFVNAADMELLAALRIEQLQVLGNYTLHSWISKSAGPCTVTLSEVYVDFLSMMEVARYGNLEASEIKLDISVKKITLDYQNLGFFASLFQGMMNTIGTFVFDSIKPFILAEMNAKVRGGINTNMRSMKQTFPNSIPPLDLAVAELRKQVRKMGYDPYKINDYSQSIGFMSFYVTNTMLTGVSSFYRVGNVTASIKNNTLHLGFNIGTQELLGQCNWELSAGGFLSHPGSACFTVEYIQVEAKVSQPLDTRQHPALDELQLKMGNIQLRSDGTGTLDYVMEAAVNILPNLLRFQILDALEDPLRRRAQEMFNTINVEKVIEEHLHEIDQMTTKTDLVGNETIVGNGTMVGNGTIATVLPTAETIANTTTKPMEGLVIDESQLDQNIF